MAARLRNILSFAAVPPAGSVSLPHLLKENNDLPVIPNVLLLSTGGFTATADATNVTVTNTGALPADVLVLAWRWHSIERAFGAAGVTALVPEPFVAGAGGGAGGIGGGGVATRVAFWTGAAAIGSDADLYWDNVGKRLGVGTALPTVELDVVGDAAISGKLTVGGAIDPTMVLLTGADKRFGATDAGAIYLAPFANATAAVQVRKADNATVVLDVDTTNNRVGINNAAPAFPLDVTGSVHASLKVLADTSIEATTFVRGAWVELPEQGADPLAAANEGRVYTKDVAGVTELFYRASDGTISQMTPVTPSTPSGWADDGTVVRLTTVTDQVGIGTAAPAAGTKLHVTGGKLRVDDFIYAADGSEIAPAYTWTSETGTGFWRTAGRIAASVGGTSKVEYSVVAGNHRFLVPGGILLQPGLGWLDSYPTYPSGMYWELILGSEPTLNFSLGSTRVARVGYRGTEISPKESGGAGQTTTALKVIGASHNNQPLTEINDVYIDLNNLTTFSTIGGVALNRSVRIRPRRFADDAGGAVTFTTQATFAVDGFAFAAIAGNALFTTNYAILVDPTNVTQDGEVVCFGNTTFSQTIGASQANARFNQFIAPTITSAAAGPPTVTTAATVYISGAPIQAGTAVLTATHPLWVDSGEIRLDSAVAVGGGGDPVPLLGLLPTGATAAQAEWIVIWTQNGKRAVPAWTIL